MWKWLSEIDKRLEQIDSGLGMEQVKNIQNI
jgi:hypothetical protein